MPAPSTCFWPLSPRHRSELVRRSIPVAALLGAAGRQEPGANYLTILISGLQPAPAAGALLLLLLLAPRCPVRALGRVGAAASPGSSQGAGPHCTPQLRGLACALVPGLCWEARGGRGCRWGQGDAGRSEPLRADCVGSSWRACSRSGGGGVLPLQLVSCSCAGITQAGHVPALSPR